jgi:hypothetical protein
MIIDFICKSVGKAVAMRYKPESRGFGSRWCRWKDNVPLTFSSPLPQEIFPEGKGDKCVGLITLPPTCTDCLEICERQRSGTFWACPGL